MQQRFRRHINDATHDIIDTHFARAIKKYGKENFWVECIDTANTQEQLTQKEQYWIRVYNSICPDVGYNETDAAYKCGGNTYQSKTDLQLENIKDKIRRAKLGAKNCNAKSVKCFNVDTGEELVFQTVNECRQYFDEKHHRFITTRTSGNTRALYKNIWKIAYFDDEYANFVPKTTRRRFYIEVVDGADIISYTSLSQVRNDFGLTWHNFTRHLCSSDGTQKNQTYYEILVRKNLKITITVLS